MSVIYSNPDGVHAPAGQYSHSALTEPGRFVFIAGQVGFDIDGQVVGPDDVGAQFKQAFANLVAILHDVGASASDVVDMKSFLVGEESLAPWRAARHEIFAEHYPHGGYPPHTLLIVSALAAPELRVEVSATARLP